MRKKLPLLLFIAAFAAAAYYVYPVINNRYLKDGPKTIKNTVSEQKSENNDQGAQSDEQETPKAESETKSTSLSITVTSKDCDNECSRFKKDEETEYCEQICGISELYEQDYEKPDATDEESSVDCEKVAGLQKDYCLKDKAIEDGDFQACSDIKDSGIKKTCENRITEDLMEEQMNQGSAE